MFYRNKMVEELKVNNFSKAALWGVVFTSLATLPSGAGTCQTLPIGFNEANWKLLSEEFRLSSQETPDFHYER